MKAVRVNKFGSPGVLVLEDNVPVVEPGPKQVLVELKFAGVNPVDTYIRAGHFTRAVDFPFVPGLDGSGLVSKLGEDVQNFQVGERVFCTVPKMGTYAQFVLAELHEVFALPDSVTFAQGAAVGVAYVTAYRALVHKTKAKAGETVLIHGASGGVGLAAVQIAKHLGCVVYGTASSEEGMKLVKEEGADEAFEHRRSKRKRRSSSEVGYMKQILDATNGNGVDVIVEMLADVNLSADLEILANDGRIAVVGCRGLTQIMAADLMSTEGQVFGIAYFKSTPEEFQEIGNKLVEGLKEGWIRPVVAREYDLDEAAEAHIDVMEHKGGARGKIVLKIAMLLSSLCLARAAMKAVRVYEFGPPGVLVVEQNVPVPEPDENQILIQLKAAGVNPMDTYVRAGTYAVKPTLPFTPGKDGAGVVTKLGDRVNNFKLGQRVFCSTQVTGTYAEYVVADPHEAFPLPDSMSFSQGASVGVPYFTAYRGLVKLAKVKSGEVVLIHGASGAVGVAAVQIAKHLGCVVYGTAGSAEGLKLAEEQGATKVFNHRVVGHMMEIQEATGGKGVDVILEMLADANLGSDLEILAPNARVIVVGCRGPSRILARNLMSQEACIVGLKLRAYTSDELVEAGNKMVEGMKDGWIRPVVDREYDLADACKAHVDVVEHRNGARGKIVLALGESENRN